MAYQTNFQLKNYYPVIKKQLLNILDKENTQYIQNYNNFITPSSNLSIINYNGLLDTVHKKYLKKN